MHPSQLPGGHALAITTEGIIPFMENDVVIVGVKCWIDNEGKAVPYNDRIQPFRKELNDELGKNVFLFKRINKPSDETSK